MLPQANWEDALGFQSTWNKLFKERIIFVMGTVNEAMAYDVTMKLLLMETANPKQPIYMYINSAGGSVADGLAIYDTMQFIQPHVYTVGVGKCMSMGAVLLAAGHPGKRLVLPHTKVMVHQPLGGIQGTSSNMEAAVESMVDYRNKLKKILMDHCGRTAEEVGASPPLPVPPRQPPRVRAPCPASPPPPLPSRRQVVRHGHVLRRRPGRGVGPGGRDRQAA